MNIINRDNGVDFEAFSYWQRLLRSFKSDWFVIPILFAIPFLFLKERGRYFVSIILSALYFLEAFSYRKIQLRKIDFNEGSVYIEYFEYNTLKTGSYNYEDLIVEKHISSFKFPKSISLAFIVHNKTIIKQNTFENLDTKFIDAFVDKYRAIRFDRRSKQVRE